MTTKVVRSISELNHLKRTWRDSQEGWGFVPTMGALHAGHLSLAEQSRKNNARTLFSIFVNPTQFNDPTDLEKYPRTLDSDLALLSSSGVDAVFVPSAQEMYPDNFSYRITESVLSQQLEGESRPGHFSGMLTVVLKLLLLADADHAYFGEKDFQQLQLVSGMARAFFVRTKIVGCPTIRTESGLAMSSRNALLPPEARDLSAQFSKILLSSASAGEAKTRLQAKGFEVDYVVDQMGRRLGAIRVSGVRLIDNFSLEEIQK
ncbi:MAG: pantoate--beta-alanine ligase [Bdellovibrionales bacterium]|nr:pantoate--beta-alanine ligase [Bdellovibrionales bacterium]